MPSCIMFMRQIHGCVYVEKSSIEPDTARRTVASHTHTVVQVKERSSLVTSLVGPSLAEREPVSRSRDIARRYACTGSGATPLLTAARAVRVKLPRDGRHPSCHVRAAKAESRSLLQQVTAPAGHCSSSDCKCCSRPSMSCMASATRDSMLPTPSPSGGLSVTAPADMPTPAVGAAVAW